MQQNEGIDRQHRLARIWSNCELRKVVDLFGGDVINVSGGDDLDKEGSTYREYFRGARSYRVTNWGPGSFRGFQGRTGEILLDLAEKLPPELEQKFDVVFNHTTLEHIFEVRRAFANLCAMSRDAVLLVVPFCQVQHENEGYQDFWRFTPTCLRRLFADEGFDVIYEAANDDFNAAVYLFFVASRTPNQWRERMPRYDPIEVAGRWVGAPERSRADKVLRAPKRFARRLWKRRTNPS